ncbi:hypothetical protein MLD38_000819 [Melastoma candidum]|uniref:Uncharacterized protein n=1 Tax=Melastoma candidum TaxID=119954 RepID=A0ACB9SBD6_9MYRT|nr:hypothetical protein MLD38_000819 [Melastoma candidum]
MAMGQKLAAKGPSPPDLYSVQLRLLVPPLGETPPTGVNFGDMKQDVILSSGKPFQKGDRVNATFWSANPRYDLLTEGTFAVVERLEAGKWIPSYDDDDFCLYFKYAADISGYNGSAIIEWELPEDVTPGIYRLRHFGSSKKTTDSPTQYFTGASSAFEVS